MACGEPSPSYMKQMELAICQVCGRHMNSCNNEEHAINYQKQVDPPANVYTQIFPDSRYEEMEETLRRKKGKNSCPKKAGPIQVCIPIPVVPGKASNSQGGTTQTPTREKVEESTETKEQTQTGGTGISSALKVNRLLLFLLASCLPVGGGSCPPPVKMMLCLPCPPPESIAGSSSAPASSTPCPKKKPTDYTYRCESRELRGGNLYQCCQCNKRNGLQHDCPRTPCQGRPACLTKPWPDCWPSGGCHGIDFTREKGLKRMDPCHAQRFDKKECKPPGASSKADCGGNMMVVVCPPPTSNC